MGWKERGEKKKGRF
uniref:Uncharacterized protein n=1 Tax=Arundo donax TaxID=35708 RepID=A0A0A9DYH6_ARUDO